MFPFDDVIMYTLNPGQFLVASSAIGSNSGVVNRSLDPENDKAWWSSPENRIIITVTSLRWRRNGRDSVSNHQPHDCLLNRLFRRRSKKTSKLRVTGVLSAPCWSHEPCYQGYAVPPACRHDKYDISCLETSSGFVFHMADSRFGPSQCEMALFCNYVSHWLGACLESALFHFEPYGRWKHFFINMSWMLCKKLDDLRVFLTCCVYRVQWAGRSTDCGDTQVDSRVFGTIAQTQSHHIALSDTKLNKRAAHTTDIGL